MSAAGTARRIVSIWLPHFPIERWQRLRPARGDGLAETRPADSGSTVSRTVVLVSEGAHGPVIHAADRQALQAGVQPGARLADMRALCPELQVEAADPQGDRAALDRLALWARRWCPWTVADHWLADPHHAGAGVGLILDSTGSDHLYGGETAFLAAIEADLAALGFTARPALASGWGAAWALARFGPLRAILPASGDAVPPVAALPGLLASLPVASLRLEAQTVLLLNRLGLRSLGLLAAMPRLSLARRFRRAALAQNPLLRLDQLTGRLAEPVSPPGAPQVLRCDLRLAEPIFDPTHHLPELCRQLCDRLAAAGQGARLLRLSVYRTDGEVSRVEASCAAASRAADHMLFLFRDRLERLSPGYGFDLISLEVLRSEDLAARQADLAGQGTGDPGLDLAQLVDRLAVRFGASALRQLTPMASHLPERAEGRIAPLRTGRGRPEDQAMPVPGVMAERPCRLLDPAEEVEVLYAVPEGPPAQFRWRRRLHRVTRFEGPERIAPEWWQDRSGTRLRDYYRIEDEAGHRFWLYREGLHDDGRGGTPRWFLHGLFA